MSIESQLREAERRFADHPGLEIIERFEEARSAKAPGRPIFNDMVDRLERGEADGIIAWAPDRLARNSIDGGRLVYLLDLGVLKDLRFATYTFENNSQGKFMLQIMFGQSKYYSDALSDNVRRGNRTKAENGWLPGRPPVGYMNDPVTRQIVRDPERHRLVRRMFDLVLAGQAVRSVATLAREDWGLLTRTGKYPAGRPLSMGTVYKMLANPFYAGQISHGGKIYVGKHQPLVSWAEFDQIQALLKRRNRPRPKTLQFTYRGLIQCGSCDSAITAERKTNAYGSTYVYYRCSRRAFGPRCREGAIEEKVLEAEIASFLRLVLVPERFRHWIAAVISEDVGEQLKGAEAERRSKASALADVTSQLAELTRMRLRQMIGDDEFTERRKELEARRVRLETPAQSQPTEADLFRLFENALSASNWAAEWFLEASAAEKRLLVETLCSDFFLRGRKPSIQAAKPFRTAAKIDRILSGRRRVYDVRTKSERQLVKTLYTELKEPEVQASLKRLQECHQAHRRQSQTDSPTDPRCA